MHRPAKIVDAEGVRAIVREAGAVLAGGLIAEPI
jgi:hypothetical protein